MTNNDGGFFYFIKIIKNKYFFSLCLKQDLKNNLQIFFLKVILNYNKYFLRPTVVVNLLDDCRMVRIRLRETSVCQQTS